MANHAALFERRRSAPRACRNAYSLIEAVVAMSLTVTAGAVLALTMESSLKTNQDNLQQLIAGGLAEQLLDEILGQRYVSAGGDPLQYPLTASAVERAAPSRSLFDDIDDFNGYAAQPVEDRWGQPLAAEDDAGGLRHPAFQFSSDRMKQWGYRVNVYYVDDADLQTRLADGQTSYHRAVEVSVIYQDPNTSDRRTVSTLRRVVAYMPPRS